MITRMQTWYLYGIPINSVTYDLDGNLIEMYVSEEDKDDRILNNLLDNATTLDKERLTYVDWNILWPFNDDVVSVNDVSIKWYDALDTTS